MLLVQEILGDASESRFAGREVDALDIDSADAAKRRIRRRTRAGSDVAIDLERGSYLRHGAVLADDGETIVAVQRQPEDAMTIRFSAELAVEKLIAQAVRLGHAFGNQHVPVQVEGAEVHVPITTSRELAEETVQALDLHGIEIAHGKVPLGKEHPLSVGHGH